MQLTQEYLKEALHYDPETGIFMWREDRPESHFRDWRGRNGFLKNIKNGLKAGSLKPATKRNPNPYWVIGILNKVYPAHRLAWLYVYGQFPEEDIDHINLDPQDNRISNLRLSIDKINHKNRSCYKNSSSNVPGVSWNSKLNKWQAEGQETVDGERKRYYLGVHKTLFDAVAVRKSWELSKGYSENHGKKIDKFYTEE